jgi:3-hydroxybutyryl-CoA dehydrogenase
MNSIQSICVCGSGTMGSGIAQVSAQSGFHTILYDVNREVLAKAREAIEKNLASLVSRNKMSGTDKEAVLSRMQFTSDINDCIADIIIEAIVEKPEVKIALFNQLAEVNHSETIFATNTSSLSVAQIANGVAQPKRVVGMHFFNPATLMKLVEVVEWKDADPAVVQKVIELARQLGKTPVLCKDAPGFIVNHVARPYYLEALRLIELNLADIESVDQLLEASGFKMGPFRLMDLIGNDINYAVSCSVYEQLGSPARLKPSPIQQQKVSAGHLGRKTGQGYYQYS